MSLTGAHLRLGGLVLALCAAPSCGGERIRLGDDAKAGGPTGTAATSANGGSNVAAGGSTGAEGGTIAGSGVSTDSGAGGDSCVHGQVAAEEVLWIGDSWIIDPGTQRSTVKQLAFAAGAIAENEEYPSLAAAAASMAMVAQQYDARQRGTPGVKVLLMDGGTWDPISAQATGGSVPEAIDEAIAGFDQFLSRVASDGTVEHIVYFLVPELMNIPGVAEMRPRLRQVCAASTVPCHFIDLQEVWEQGDPLKYTAGNGFQASADGGVAIGRAVWATMQTHCIAQ
jgi:hypothetical protein